MQKLSTVKRVTATLFTLLMLWGAFYVAKMLLEIKPNNNIHYIPEDANFVARIDGRQLFEKGFRSIVFNEDSEIIDLLDQIFERKAGEDEERKPLGITFHSDIIFFNTTIKDDNINGFLFNVENERLFEDNVNALLREHQVASCKGNVGIILTDDNENSSLSHDDLNMLATNLLQSPTNFDVKEKLDIEEDQSVLRSWSKSGIISESELVSASKLSCALEDNKVEINGTITFDHERGSKLRKKLKAENTHMTSTLVSKAINDSVNSFFEELNLPKADIIGISMNYKGTEIVENPSFVIVPYVDMLVETKNDYTLKRALDSAAMLEDDIELHENYFKYGGKPFHFIQLKPNLFYIGVTKDPEVVDIEKDLLFEISGPLSPLTSFYGKGMMRRFLELIPLYSASKDLANKVNEIDFSIRKAGINKGVVKGEIEFKEENFALNALIHFAVQGQLIK